MSFRIVAFDVETISIQGKFLSAAVVSDQFTGFTQDPNEAMEWLRKHAAQKYTLFAHNAEYDVCALFWPLGERIQIHYYNGQFNRANWWYCQGSKSVEVWDSMNLAAGEPLSTLGKSVGLPKLALPAKLAGKATDRYQWKCESHGNWECIECYNLRDAEIVYRYVNRFADWFQSHDLRLKRTLGGNAVAFWQSVDVGSQQTLKAPLIKDLSRAAYHAGRNEVFKPGYLEHIFTADIRAAHCNIMATCPMPDTSSLTYVENPKGFNLAEVHGVIEATVEVPRMHIPPLPVRMNDGHTYYPIGRFRGAWTIPELNAAEREGVQIRKVHKAAYSKKSVIPFSSFALGLWILRQEAEKAGNGWDFLYKTLCNSLPGRIGIRDEQEYRLYEASNRFLTDDEVRGKDIYHINGARVTVTERTVRRLSSMNNVLWSATINGYMRVQINQWLRKAGEALAYCDTDSLFSLEPLPVVGDSLGQLRDTGAYERGYIYGPKLYRLENGMDQISEVARGIPKQLVWEFLEHGTISFGSAVGVVMGVRMGVSPTHWDTIIRTNRNHFTNRVIVGGSGVPRGNAHAETLPVSVWEVPGEPEAVLLARRASK